jgi:hypothetical protein
MPIRTFTDSRGIAWRVWSTTPADDSPLRRYYPDGWLTFDSGSGTLRRLSPAPVDWHLATVERLELMCRVAEEVPRHTGEMRKVDRPADFPPPADPGAASGAPDDSGLERPRR